MNNVCIIQYAWGEEFLHQVQITSNYTFLGCKNFSYDYRLYTNKPRTNVMWEKPKLILETLNHNYETVIWLDTDCLWLSNEPLDNVNTSCFGMTYHHACSHQSIDHYNAGMIIINNSKETIYLMNEWLNESDDNHQWQEQYALNKIIKRKPHIVCCLENKYNSVCHIPEYSSNNPIIVSWHGTNNRNNKMIEYIKRLNND